MRGPLTLHIRTKPSMQTEHSRDARRGSSASVPPRTTTPELAPRAARFQAVFGLKETLRGGEATSAFSAVAIVAATRSAATVAAAAYATAAITAAAITAAAITAAAAAAAVAAAAVATTPHGTAQKRSPQPPHMNFPRSLTFLSHPNSAVVWAHS